MLRSRTLRSLISVIILAGAVVGDVYQTRQKRQAPNINVHQIPKTSFSCVDRRIGEYYADPETNCQVYHVCIPGMNNKMSLISFVCPNGTIFSQATRVCTPYERIDCSLTSTFNENVHGGANSRRTDYDNDFDNYVPQSPPREQSRPSSTRGRNTPAPTVPPRETPAQPPRNTRFRSGSSQFRGQQAAPSTTVTPTPVRTSPPSVPARVAPARPAPPAFRPPALPIRPAGGLSNVLPPRPTPRAIVSTSTSSYSYEYEYDYEDYADEAPAADQPNTRSKREAPVSGDYDVDTLEEKPFFNCQDKIAGGVYADIESNCEMFHICVPLGKYKMLDYKVFCAKGTAFDQETGSCRQKEEFTCENARLYYQFEKPNQPASSKKPIFKKKMLSKSKKAKHIIKE